MTRNRIEDTVKGYAGANDAGCSTMTPMNDFERLQQENEKLHAINRNQEIELLGLYRRLSNTY